MRASVARVFEEHGKDYLNRHARCLLPSHRKAILDITGCRSEPMGAHLYECNHCGYLHVVYHSCRNRSCPRCQRADACRWIDNKAEQVLPVRYFHLVFTLPHELNEIMRSHQIELYPVLMRAAARSVIELARDPRYVGAMIGVLAVLHTWTRAMLYHPHVHCLIPGGGITEDGSKWMSSRKSFLVPVRALSVIFRAMFMEEAQKAVPEVDFPESVWHKDWVVYSKPCIDGGKRVVEYLGRYVKRVAITDSRILSIEQGFVTFSYKDSRDGYTKTMRLCAEEFIRRFLQHVLPRGLHKIRSYGLLSPVNHHLLGRARELIPEPLPKRPKEPSAHEKIAPILYCPKCSTGLLILVATVSRTGRGPP